jgi:hypothetical protein
MHERKPVRADSADHVVDRGLPPDCRYVARAGHSAIDREVEDAKVFASAQPIAIDEIPIFLAIDFIAFGGTHREDVPASECLFYAVRVISRLRHALHCPAPRIVQVVRPAALVFQCEGTTGLEIFSCHDVLQ